MPNRQKGLEGIVWFSQGFSAEKSCFRIITSVLVVIFLNEHLFAWKYVLVLIFNLYVKAKKEIF